MHLDEFLCNKSGKRIAVMTCGAGIITEYDVAPKSRVDAQSEGCEVVILLKW
jgi:hypothetical protein